MRNNVILILLNIILLIEYLLSEELKILETYC